MTKKFPYHFFDNAINNYVLNGSNKQVLIATVCEIRKCN